MYVPIISIMNAIWTHLPSDVIQVVFSFISLDELMILSLVSKSTQKCASWTNTIQTSPFNDDDDNEGIIHNHNNNANESMKQPSRFGRNSVHLRKSLPNVMNMDPISAALPMTSCAKDGIFMTEEKLKRILSRFQNATTIKLHHLSRMGISFLHVLNHATFHRPLTHVEFHHVHMMDSMVIPSSISQQQQQNLQRQFQHLQHVELHGTIFSTYSSTLQYLTSSSPYLKTLKLSGCRQLYDEDILDIMQRVQSQQPQQHYDYPHTRSKLYPQDPPSSQLQVVSFDNASKLIAPKIQSDTIHTLDLHQCIQLKTLIGIQCKNLLKMDLSYCSSIGNGQVEALIRHSPYIQHLILKACTGISNLIVYSTSLKDIDVSMCTMLSNLTLDCKSLELCEVGMCMKLKELYIQSDTIKGMDLSMLLLNQMTIKTPRLTMLNLSGCYKLMDEGVHLLNCSKLIDVDICETKLSSNIFTAHGKEHGIRVKVKQGGTGIDWMKMSGF